MAVIAVINGKGGAGKSTVASHLAAYCAIRNAGVALYDLDPQKSTEIWLKLRPVTSARICGRSNAGSFTRPLADARHVVVDTPSGFQGMPYLRLMMHADAVLVPTAFSIFDRGALANIVRTLRATPRVAAGACTIACVGTRIDPNTNDAELLETMLRDLAVPYLGSIPAARVYSRCLEQGLSVFDFPSDVAQSQMPHWTGVISWLETIFAKTSRPSGAPRAATQRPPIATRPPLASSLIRNIPRFLVR